jgi:hypothetical protein
LPRLRTLGVAAGPPDPGLSPVRGKHALPTRIGAAAEAGAAGAPSPEGDEIARIEQIDDDFRRRGGRPPLAARLRRAVHISNLMPVVGALPTAPDAAAGPPPFVLGVAGLWR